MANIIEIIKNLQQESRDTEERTRRGEEEALKRQQEIRSQKLLEFERLRKESGVEEHMDTIGKNFLGKKTDADPEAGEWRLGYHNVIVDPETGEWQFPPDYDPSLDKNDWHTPRLELEWREDRECPNGHTEICHSVLTVFDMKHELVIVKGAKEETIVRGFQLPHLTGDIPLALGRAFINPTSSSKFVSNTDYEYHDYSNNIP